MIYRVRVLQGLNVIRTYYYEDESKAKRKANLWIKSKGVDVIISKGEFREVRYD